MTALLLGVGGAAMWRFVRAYLPECAPTLVDSDEAVVAIARRWFYLNQPVVIDTARALSRRHDAEIRCRCSSISTIRAGRREFDDGVLDALPRCAGAWRMPCHQLGRFRGQPQRQADRRQLQQEVARGRGLDCAFVTRRGFRDNLIQYLPTGPQRGPEAILPAHERFARDRRLPNRGRGILEHCLITTEFPLDLG